MDFTLKSLFTIPFFGFVKVSTNIFRKSIFQTNPFSDLGPTENVRPPLPVHAPAAGWRDETHPR